MEFIYTVDPYVDEPIMLLSKHIGSDYQDDGFGVDGAQFQAELLALDSMGKKEINVFINSVGGMVIDGMSIYNSIISSKTPVNTVCCGIAASIAAVIFQAGKKRIMYDYSCLMYHNPYNENGNKDKSLEMMRKSIITMICERCSMSEDEVSKMMDATTWTNAEDSLKMGLCDEIKSSSENIDIKNMVDINAKWQVSNKILNKFLNKNNTTKMKIELAKILNLAEDASEESIYNVVKALLAKKNEADEDKAEDEDEDKSDYKAMYDTLLNEFNSMKSEMDEAKNKLVKDSINELVMNAVKDGKIKNDASTIDRWTKIATADLENAKNLLADITANKIVNKTSTKIETSDDKKIDPRMVGYKSAPAVDIMSEIMNKLKK